MIPTKYYLYSIRWFMTTAWLFLCFDVGLLFGREIVFPSQTFTTLGVINVKANPFGPSAIGNGNSLDYDAIQSAVSGCLPYATVSGAKYLYFPNGTYLIDKTIKWEAGGRPRKGLILIGQSKENTILKFSPGVASGSIPVPMIMMNDDKFSDSSLDSGTNSAFQNYILNMTLNTGSGNPQAVGLSFFGNNLGGAQDLNIVSGDQNGAGLDGISMTRDWSGPAFFKNITIDGFNYGIRVSEAEGIPVFLSETFEHVILRNQKKSGFFSNGNILTVRDLSSAQSLNDVPAITNYESGVFTLIDAGLGGGSGGSAILNRDSADGFGRLLCRNVTVTGYSSAIMKQGKIVSVPGTYLKEFITDSVSKVFPSQNTTLGLPVKETPEYFDADPNNWILMQPPALDPDVNSTMIQSAINSASPNKTTLCFPSGVYTVSQTISIHNLRMVMGTGTTILGDRNSPVFSNSANPGPLIEFNGSGGSLRLENLILGDYQANHNPTGLIFLRHASGQDLILSRMLMWGSCVAAYVTNTSPDPLSPIPGNLFLEDVASNNGAIGWQFAKKQQIWARQFNPEGSDRTLIQNNGGQLWILGLKTEGHQTIINTNSGGSTELLGGLIKVDEDGLIPSVPAFINADARVSLSYVDQPQPHSHGFPIQVQDSVRSVLKTLANQYNRIPSDAGSAKGNVMALYSSCEPNKQTNIPMSPGQLPILMDKTEVTQAEFTAVMGWNPSAYQGPGYQFSNRPVESVTWYDAVVYCNTKSMLDGLQPVYTYQAGCGLPSHHCSMLSGLTMDVSKTGYRLPLGSEWLKAYQAGSTTDYYWGNDDSQKYTWSSLNSGFTEMADSSNSLLSHPVGQKTNNAWGLFDMAGNVSEWIWATGLSGFAAGGAYSDLPALQKDTSISTYGKNQMSPKVGFRTVRKSLLPTFQAIQSNLVP